MPGGLSDCKKADDDIIQILSSVKHDFENRCYNTDIFKGKLYKTQVVAGINYFIKVKTSKEIAHIRVYKSLDSQLTLHSYQLNKEDNDVIEYF